jgi:uncharacterized protein
MIIKRWPFRVQQPCIASGRVRQCLPGTAHALRIRLGRRRRCRPEPPVSFPGMVSSWTARPFELQGAIQHTLSAGDKPTDQWQVSVALPPPNLQALTGPGPFAALYLLDGWLTFVVAAQIAATTLAFSLGQLRPVVVVGISPATEDLDRLMAQHVRDLTPTGATPAHLQGRTPYGTGGASAMLNLICDVIAPYLESRYPLDPSDRGLGGISLGGMFSCWTLLTQPRRFHRYLAVSPSLYWDDHLLLDEQRLPALDPGRRDVYLAVGEREDGPARQWPVVPAEMRDAASGIDLVADMASFADRLRRHRDIEVRAEIIPDEQHATVWPAAVTRGLVHLYRTDR